MDKQEYLLELFLADSSKHDVCTTESMIKQMFAEQKLLFKTVSPVTIPCYTCNTCMYSRGEKMSSSRTVT